MSTHFLSSNLSRRTGRIILLAGLIVSGAWAQKGTTLNAGDTLYPGWADSLGTQSVVAQDGKSLCCGSWFADQSIKFNSVDFGSTPFKYLMVRYSSGEPGCALVPSHDPPKQVSGTWDGGTSLISSPATFNAFPLAPTGGWDGYVVARIRVLPTTGVKPLYFFSGRCGVTGGTVNLSWFTFTNDSTSPTVYDWTLPKDIIVKPGDAPSSVIAMPAAREFAQRVQVTASGLALHLTDGVRQVMIVKPSGAVLTELSVQGPGTKQLSRQFMGPGMYLVRIVGQSGTLSGKVIVK